MAYQTLCHRFSMAVTVPVALGTGMLSSMALGTTLGLPEETASNLGFFIGYTGFFFGGLAESVAAEVLHTKSVGVSRGSRIVQRAGLTAYGVTLAAGLAFMAAVFAPDKTVEERKDVNKALPAPLRASPAQKPVVSFVIPSGARDLV